MTENEAIDLFGYLNAGWPTVRLDVGVQKQWVDFIRELGRTHEGDYHRMKSAIDLLKRHSRYFPSMKDLRDAVTGPQLGYAYDKPESAEAHFVEGEHYVTPDEGLEWIWFNDWWIGTGEAQGPMGRLLPASGLRDVDRHAPPAGSYTDDDAKRASNGPWKKSDEYQQFLGYLRELRSSQVGKDIDRLSTDDYMKALTGGRA